MSRGTNEPEPVFVVTADYLLVDGIIYLISRSTRLLRAAWSRGAKRYKPGDTFTTDSLALARRLVEHGVIQQIS
jgi:hypothetical protein